MLDSKLRPVVGIHARTACYHSRNLMNPETQKW